MKPFRRSFIVITCVALFGAATFVLWPKEPPLVLFTSDPITIKGKTFRLQALVPSDWRADPVKYVSPTLIPATDDPKNAIGAYIVIAPQARIKTWMPEWLRKRLLGDPEPSGIVLGPASRLGEPGAPVVNGISTSQGDGFYYAHRIVGGEDGYGIVYFRRQQAGFLSTYRRICESFKVVQ